MWVCGILADYALLVAKERVILGWTPALGVAPPYAVSEK